MKRLLLRRKPLVSDKQTIADTQIEFLRLLLGIKYIVVVKYIQTA